MIKPPRICRRCRQPMLLSQPLQASPRPGGIGYEKVHVICPKPEEMTPPAAPKPPPAEPPPPPVSEPPPPKKKRKARASKRSKTS